MRILYSLLDFREPGGSQMYTYTLAKEMVKRGHEVAVMSTIDLGKEVTQKAIEAGIGVIPFSLKHTLKEEGLEFDIIHASHIPIINALIKEEVLPDTPIVCTNHSEFLPFEMPVIDERVKHYIGVRQTICSKLIESGIEKEKISLIYNPIDSEIYNTDNTSEGNYILFCGSLDWIRKEAFLKTIEYAIENKLKVIHIGRNDYPELEKEFMNICEFKSPAFNPVDLVKNCRMTAGIIAGRSMYEGLFCGKPCLDFTVDQEGAIIKQELKDPKNCRLLLKMVDSKFVASQIEKNYNDAITKS